jgi:hypothetical protein
VSDSIALAGRLRAYIAERKASIAATVMAGGCDTMEHYQAALGRHASLVEVEEEINLIMKDFNDGV